jgi:predicted amidohydrolase
LRTRIAAAQLQSSVHPEENLAKAEVAIREAKKQGASMVIFPEVFMAWLAPEAFRASNAQRVAQSLNGPFVQGLARAAKRAEMWLICGMLEMAEPGAEKVYNTTVVFNEHGELVSYYRKTHLFDAFGYRESDVYITGDQLFTPMETPFGRMGLFVCYELRIPEVARTQVVQGVDFFVLPSAWVNGSLKEMHWRHLVMARAIENTAYVLACDQVGNQYMGRSLLVDPLGVVMAEGTEEEGLLYAEIDTQRLVLAREKLPSLQHRRPALYRMMPS